MEHTIDNSGIQSFPCQWKIPFLTRNNWIYEQLKQYYPGIVDILVKEYIENITIYTRKILEIRKLVHEMKVKLDLNDGTNKQKVIEFERKYPDLANRLTKDMQLPRTPESSDRVTTLQELLSSNAILQSIPSDKQNDAVKDIQEAFSIIKSSSHVLEIPEQSSSIALEIYKSHVDAPEKWQTSR